MDDTVERLAFLRKKAEIHSKRQAAQRYGIDYETYKKIAAGERTLTREHAERIAGWHHVSRGWLMFGEGTPEGELSMKVAGFISAGQQLTLFDDVQDHGTVDALISTPDAAALEVRGDSMLPLARHKDIIFVAPPQRELQRLIGSECAVLLEDGSRYFKILERGSRSGLYDLRSHNAEPMRDVEVHSAGRFLGLRRR